MPRGLTREKLVSKALEIVDRDGLSGLSMRKLGAELGVDPMAAYRHLPNKDALLDGVVEAVVSEVDLSVDPSMSWQEQLRSLGRANLRALLAHPNAAPLLAQRSLSTPNSLRLVERLFEILDGAGISLREAGLTVNVIGLLTSAIALAEGSQPEQVEDQMAEEAAKLMAALPRDEFPLIHRALETGELATGFEAVLEYAMDTIIERLERIAPTSR